MWCNKRCALLYILNTFSWISYRIHDKINSYSSSATIKSKDYMLHMLVRLLIWELYYLTTVSSHSESHYCLVFSCLVFVMIMKSYMAITIRCYHHHHHHLVWGRHERNQRGKWCVSNTGWDWMPEAWSGIKWWESIMILMPQIEETHLIWPDLPEASLMDLIDTTMETTDRINKRPLHEKK